MGIFNYKELFSFGLTIVLSVFVCFLHFAFKQTNTDKTIVNKVYLYVMN